MYKVRQIVKVGRGLTGQVFSTPNVSGQGKYHVRIQESELPDAHKPQWSMSEAELDKHNQ